MISSTCTCNYFLIYRCASFFLLLFPLMHYYNKCNLFEIPFPFYSFLVAVYLLFFCQFFFFLKSACRLLGVVSDLVLCLNGWFFFLLFFIFGLIVHMFRVFKMPKGLCSSSLRIVWYFFQRRNDFFRFDRLVFVFFSIDFYLFVLFSKFSSPLLCASAYLCFPCANS